MSLSLSDPYTLLAVTHLVTGTCYKKTSGHLSFCSWGSDLLEGNQRSLWLLIPTGGSAGDAALLLTEDRPCWGFLAGPSLLWGFAPKGRKQQCLFSSTVPSHLSPTEDWQVLPAMLVAQLRGWNTSLKICASRTPLLR